MDLSTFSMAISKSSAIWFLPFVAPLCVWAIFSDLMNMKIRNQCVLAMMVVFAVVGFFVLPFDAYLWRWSHFAVILVIGFVLNMGGMFGAGDAKFAAAMAPFFHFGDYTMALYLYCLTSVGGFVLHRLIRRVPLITNATPDWHSWTSKRMPFGLSLGVMMLAYLILGAIYGA